MVREMPQEVAEEAHQEEDLELDLGVDSEADNKIETKTMVKVIADIMTKIEITKDVTTDPREVEVGEEAEVMTRKGHQVGAMTKIETTIGVRVTRNRVDQIMKGLEVEAEIGDEEEEEEVTITDIFSLN